MLTASPRRKPGDESRVHVDYPVAELRGWFSLLPPSVASVPSFRLEEENTVGSNKKGAVS